MNLAAKALKCNIQRQWWFHRDKEEVFMQHITGQNIP